MKKFVCLLLAVVTVFSLAACGMSAEKDLPLEDSAEESFPAESSFEDSSIENSGEEEAEILDVTEEEPRFDWTVVNPLTGEPSDKDYTNIRPVAVMLNNIKQALPQFGNGQADLLYEVPEEGGITRIMALYQDLTDVGSLGSIRSTRPYYVRLALANDAILVHAGGSGSAYRLIKKLMDSKYNFEDIDCLYKGTNSAESIFFRDQGRINSGYAMEHTLFTTSDNIQEWMASHSDHVQTEHRKHFRRTHTFVEDGTPALGKDCTSMDVSFSGYKGTSFHYDEESGTYQVSEFGSAYTDAATGNQVSVENVIVIQTKLEQLNDAKQRIAVYLTGEGTGYYACNGKYEPIRWVKKKARYTYSFFDQKGNEIPLGVGKSYICILDKDRPITVNDKVISNGKNGMDLSDFQELSDEEAD